MTTSESSSAVSSSAASTASSAASTAQPEQDQQEKSELQGPVSEKDTSYGKVYPQAVDQPNPTRVMEVLHDKTSSDMWCGLIGVGMAVTLAIVGLVLAIAAQKGSLAFFSLPDIRKFIKR